MSRISLLLSVLLGGLLSACAIVRSASVSVQQQDSTVDFQFQTRSFNGLGGLRVWRADTKEVFWDVNLNYYNEKHLKYGDIPKGFRTFNGNSNSATQNFPALGHQPSPLPSNAKFILELTCLYDTMFSPAFRAYYFSFTTNEKGIVSKIIPVDQIPADFFPRPYNLDSVR
jgi:hypothetical protein